METTYYVSWHDSIVFVSDNWIIAIKIAYKYHLIGLTGIKVSKNAPI